MSKDFDGTMRVNAIMDLGMNAAAVAVNLKKLGESIQQQIGRKVMDEHTGNDDKAKQFIAALTIGDLADNFIIQMDSPGGFR